MKKVVLLLLVAAMTNFCQAEDVVEAGGDVVKDSGNVVADGWYFVTSPFRPNCKKEECTAKERHKERRCHKAKARTEHDRPSRVAEAGSDVVEDSAYTVRDSWYFVTSPLRRECKNEDCRHKETHKEKCCRRAKARKHHDQNETEMAQ